MANKIKITLKRSTIGKDHGQRATIKALGLRRLHHSVIKDDRPEIRGMINKVSFMINVEEMKGKKEEVKPKK